jgi:hypothetical protein
MKAVTIRCDRCGEAIGAGRTLVVIPADAAPLGWPAETETGRASADLGPGCLGP